MWTSFLEFLADLWADDSGSNVIEYAILAGTVAMAILGPVQATASNLGGMTETLPTSFP